MGKTLYLECASGISGDMTVAALLDLGADETVLREALASLPLSGYEVRVSEVAKNGVRACDFDVRLDEGLDNHDHDMAWLYGHLAQRDGDVAGHRDDSHAHAHGDSHEHSHNHDEGHTHAHDLVDRKVARRGDGTQAAQAACRDDEAHLHDQAHGDEGHAHAHAHDAGGHHHHHHEHRGLAEVLAIVDAGRLSERARTTAHRVFEVLARAEAQAHGTTPDKVHFHEVGAVDSIVDIVSAAVCLDLLDVDQVVVPYLCEGRGTVRCAHGILPVPVPAVCATVARHGIALEVLPVQGELVTPTGAAIVAAVSTSDTLPRRMRIVATGLGAGKRDNPGTSGILRAHLIEDLDRVSEPSDSTRQCEDTAAAGQASQADAPVASDQTHLDEGAAAVEEAPRPDAPETDACCEPLPTGSGRAAQPQPDGVWKLECDVDDCTGEALGFCMGRLLDAGAKEAHFCPIYTKKNRPAWQIQVICDEGRREACEEVLFCDTTTIGVRRSWMERRVLPRRACEVGTPFGPVRAKAVTLPTGRERVWPEHDDVAAAAQASGASYQQVWRAAIASMPLE